MANYTAVTSQAQQTAATPYQAYGGDLVAGVNGQQTSGINAVNNASGIQNPYNAGATGLAAASSANIDPTQFSAAQLQQYENPYQQDVIDATMAQIGNQNQQQAASLQGNAVSAGAFGGDRAGVAQAALAGQQDIANNATLAGLNTANFQNAQGEFNTQQGVGLSAAQNTAARQLAASQQIGNLGQAAQTEALTGANAQINAGTLQQQTQQAQDTAAYNQFLQKQAYPFQTTGWLANIVEGIGSQSGGTSTGQQTTQGGSGLSSAAGGLLGLASFLNRGGRVNEVRVPHKAGGGALLPYGAIDPSAGLGAGSYVTPANLAVGHTMPTGGMPGAPAMPNAGQSMAQAAKGVQGLGNAFQNSAAGDAVGDFLQDSFGLARGGVVRPHFDRGGLTEYDPSQGLGNGDLSPELLAAYGNNGADTPSGSPAFVPPSSPLLRDATALPTPEAAMAARYANQMPAPQQDGYTPQQRLAVAMGNPLPQSGDTPPPATPAGLAAAAEPDRSAGLAKLGAAMGATPTTPRDPNAVYGGLDDAANLSAVAAAPLPPSRPTGLGAAADNSLDATAPGGFAPSARVAAAPMALPGAGLASAEANASPASDALGGVNPNARGMRNNNPGNLESNAWTSSLPGYVGSDGRFAIFSTPQAGVAALDHNLQGYGQKGIDTPLAIASTWAPGSEKGNDPSSYGGAIAKALGVGLNDPVDMTDPNNRAKIAKAIAFVENGPGSGALASAPASAAINAASPGLAAGAAPASSAYSGAPLTVNSPVASSDANPNSGGGLLGLHLSPEVRQGMLAAGLGMMGGSSMNPWINIGQGGQQGLAAYNNARKLQSQIGLQGAQAGRLNTETGLLPMEKTSEANLRNAQAGLAGGQAGGVDIENKIKQNQLDLMNGVLGKNAAAAGQKADAVASVTAPVSPSATATARNGPAAPALRLDPNFDPDVLANRVNAEKWINPQAAHADEERLNSVTSSGRSRDVNGNVVNLPGFASSSAELAANKTGAEEAVKSHYDLVDVQPTPGGPTYKVPKSQLIGGVGAGSAPGSTLDAAAAVDPTVAKQPGFNEDKQKAIASDESQMVQQYKARQLSRQRLQAITGLIQNYQPGAFAQQKAEFVAAARSLGLPIPDTATANPAAFEQFTKNATANVFNDVKDMGGRVLVSEIQGLAKANTNPELQPAANAALIGQALGVINYEDQHMKDYFAWKDKNPNTVDTSKFEIPWVDKNPVSKFVNESNKGIAYSGQQIPALASRTAGQTYMTPKGPMVWAGTGWRQPQGAAP